jgi:3-deoxy-7-phosphoheptulonate synthase
MMESHLVEGNQPLGDDVQSLTYGQSITDACMSWDTTEAKLEKLAQASRQRPRRIRTVNIQTFTTPARLTP